MKNKNAPLPHKIHTDSRRITLKSLPFTKGLLSTWRPQGWGEGPLLEKLLAVAECWAQGGVRAGESSAASWESVGGGDWGPPGLSASQPRAAPPPQGGQQGGAWAASVLTALLWSLNPLWVSVQLRAGNPGQVCPMKPRTRRMPSHGPCGPLLPLSPCEVSHLLS